MRNIAIALTLAAATSSWSALAQAPPVVRPPDTRPAGAPIPDAAEIHRRIEMRRSLAASAAAQSGRALSRPQARRQAMALTYERDPSGRWFFRGEILLATAAPGAEEAASAAGLKPVKRVDLPASGLTLYTLAPLPGVSIKSAFEALRAARPGDAVDLNYVYEFRGRRVRRPGLSPTNSAPGPSDCARKARIAAMIDGPLPANAGATLGVDVRASRFANGQARGNGHALAVAEILVETAGRDGLMLLAADVSDAGPLKGGSAAAISQALDWAVSAGASVVNISLTGPPNATLAEVVRRLSARGVIFVAAAGNEGPSAPAPYPAAIDAVVGVTAVDSEYRIWRRATQGPHVDFAAQGVRVRAAGGVWTGTSFAAPVVSGLLLREDVSLAELVRDARDLGAKGRDAVYGQGYLAAR